MKKAHPGLEKCFCMHPEEFFETNTTPGSVVTAAKAARLVAGPGLLNTRILSVYGSGSGSLSKSACVQAALQNLTLLPWQDISISVTRADS